MNQFISKLGAILTALLAIIAVAVAGLGIAVTLPRDGSYKVLIVRSGSMEPTIPVGSLVVSQKQNIYGVGDIVTFRQKESFVTHRIVAAFGDNFWVKGDANTSPDGSPVPYSAVIGKLKLTVPYAGFAVNFARTPLGFSLLIVLPALLIIIQEIFAIGRELDKAKRRQLMMRKIFDIRRVPSKWALAREAAREAAAGRRRIAQALSMLMVAIVAGLGGTKAYFSDVATSTGNVFTAGTFAAQCLETTSAGNVVINEINWGGSNAPGGGNDEWVELKNMTSSCIDLSGWVIENLGGGGINANITIPSGTIPANGFFLISSKSKADSRINVDPDFITTAISLSDGGEQLRLINSSAMLIDTANQATGPWFAGSNSAPKKSMERNLTPGDGTSSTNWQTATTHTNMDGSGATDEFGTPKAENGT